MDDTTTKPFTLVSSAQVIEAMGQDAQLAAGATEAIESAIARATIRVEGLLKTRLVIGETVDQFYIRGVTGARLDGFVRLLLSNGCIRSDIDVVVEQADALRGTYVQVDPEQVLVDFATGLVQIPEEVIDQDHLRVTYQSGFHDGDTIPDEIQHAILCLVPQFLLSHPANNGADPGNGTASAEVKKATSLAAQADDMLVPYHRRPGAVATPIHSQRIEP